MNSIECFVVSEYMFENALFRVGSDPEIRRRDNDEDNTIDSKRVYTCAQRILSRIVHIRFLINSRNKRSIGVKEEWSGLEFCCSSVSSLRLPQIREAKDERADSSRGLEWFLRT